MGCPAASRQWALPDLSQTWRSGSQLHESRSDTRPACACPTSPACPSAISCSQASGPECFSYIGRGARAWRHRDSGPSCRTAARTPSADSLPPPAASPDSSTTGCWCKRNWSPYRSCPPCANPRSPTARTAHATQRRSAAPPPDRTSCPLVHRPRPCTWAAWPTGNCPMPSRGPRLWTWKRPDWKGPKPRRCLPGISRAA